MRHGECNAIGCRALIISTEVLCARHVVMVESDTLRVLRKTYRPGQKYQSQVFRDTLDAARREILYYQTNGHKVPQDRPFEWDDDKVKSV